MACCFWVTSEELATKLGPRFCLGLAHFSPAAQQLVLGGSEPSERRLDLRFDEIGGNASVMSQRLKRNEPSGCGAGENRPSDRTLRGLGAQTISLLPMQGSGCWPTLRPMAAVGRGVQVAIWAGLAGQVWEQQEPHPAPGRRGLTIWLGKAPSWCWALSGHQAVLWLEGESYTFPCFAPFSQTCNRKNQI